MTVSYFQKQEAARSAKSSDRSTEEKELRARVWRLHQEINKLNERLRSPDTQRAADTKVLQQRIDEVKAKLDESKANAQRAQDALQAECDELRGSEDELQGLLSERDSRLKTLQEEEERLKADMDKQGASHRTDAGCIAGLRAQLAAAVTQCQAFKENHHWVLGQFQRLTETVRAQQLIIQRLEAQSGQWLHHAAAQEAESHNLRAQLEQLTWRWHETMALNSALFAAMPRPDSADAAATSALTIAPRSAGDAAGAGAAAAQAPG